MKAVPAYNHQKKDIKQSLAEAVHRELMRGENSIVLVAPTLKYVPEIYKRIIDLLPLTEIEYAARPTAYYLPLTISMQNGAHCFITQAASLSLVGKSGNVHLFKGHPDALRPFEALKLDEDISRVIGHEYKAYLYVSNERKLEAGEHE